MATIYRPCYVTREEVQRAIDVKATQYNAAQVDRIIMAASKAADRLCMRRFYPVDATYKFDWPNFQYAYPWRIWFDNYELAAIPSQVVSGTFLAVPIVIPLTSCIFQPVNEGPPFTRLELRRDLSAVFGNNTTPQLDIGITGSFGYWLQTKPGGTLAAAMPDTTTPSLQLNVGTGVNVGVGDLIVVDNERMIVTDSQFITTGVATTGTGGNTASNADATLTVPNGSLFAVGEPLVMDSETVLVNNILGNNLVVKRAFDGSTLTTHANPTLFARRQVTVLRGATGTTPATHLINAPVNVMIAPDLVKDLSVAEALVRLVGEPAAYAFLTVRTWFGSTGTTAGQQKEPAPGPGLPDLRQQCFEAYGRKARSRVV